ncbi:TetR/AcrR family transcriptional regulator [Wenjunlia vitaminophila]|uniref:TetR/AcrR family transcriptional regulator n=1 Tax=Wenjunlia vitaminophila TaxID=76728 RepID=UPI00036D38EC|nr:TetR/AcrR family transcriptional regulator [Wenjunlia vitaminophila]
MTTAHSGGGDISRSMELLWGLGERPTRGPKPGLTLERIVTAAVSVADAEGLAALSMRRVASELGVGTMSLYRYVPGKAELLDLMLDHVNGEGHPPRPERLFPADTDWRTVLERTALGMWELYHRHPWLLQVDQARPLLGPNATRGVEAVLAGIEGIGLTQPEMVAVLVTLDGFVSGVARTSVNATTAEQRTGVSNEDFWAAQVPVLEQVLTSEDYPTLSRISEEAWRSRGYFEFGLARLLDGLETYLTGEHGRPRGATDQAASSPGQVPSD